MAQSRSNSIARGRSGKSNFPALVEAFCAEYTRHLNRLRSDALASQEGYRAELRKIDKELDRLVDAIAGGVPVMGDRYREEVGRLREALNDESRREEAAELIRGLIESIVLNPDADGGGKKMLTIDLKGHLAGILALGSAAKKKKGANGAPALDQQIKLVAGAGFEPATFRL